MSEPTQCLACGHDDPHNMSGESENECAHQPYPEWFDCHCTADRRTIAALWAKNLTLRNRCGKWAADAEEALDEVERLTALNARIMQYRVDDERQRTADAALGANLRALIETHAAVIIEDGCELGWFVDTFIEHDERPLDREGLATDSTLDAALTAAVAGMGRGEDGTEAGP